MWIEKSFMTRLSGSVSLSLRATLFITAVLSCCLHTDAAASGTYTWRLTQGVLAPDCVPRPVVLVNGEFQPAIRVTAGEYLNVTVINDLPENSTVLSEGVSLHWHGFHMNGAQWYDGVGYIAHCPIKPGDSFTYTFKVNEDPGTYWWHDHSSGHRFDGLLGALVVDPPNPEAEKSLYGYDEELPPLVIQDWWNVTGTELLLGLNRPFDVNKATANSGTWKWIGLPPSVLLNGKGVTQDCVSKGAAAPTPSLSCAVTSQGPGPYCTHEVLSVQAGKSYRLRMINAASLLSLTVCFEGHEVTAIQADAMPVKPRKSNCVDMNSGQRMDVVLTASQPVGNYWITVHPQFRPGSPNGYGIIRYKSAPEALPATPAMQPDTVQPWTAADYAQLGYNASASRSLSEQVYEMPVQADRTFLVNITQPILQKTGQLRWALNNVVEVRTPPCEPLLKLARSENAAWIKQHAVTGEDDGSMGQPGGSYNGSWTVNGPHVVYLASDKPVLDYPSPGTHVLELKEGDVVDIVLQNLAPNAFNGDYRPSGWNRTAMEQHPFHLHGHHFWVVGAGTGNWTPASNATYNLDTPPLRDTATMFKDGWITIRVQANNPGVWLLHCHIAAHEFMGQGLLMVVAPGKVAEAPASLPKCNATCTSTLTIIGNGTTAAAGISPAPPPVPSTKKSDASTGHTFAGWWLGVAGLLCMLLMMS